MSSQIPGRTPPPAGSEGSGLAPNVASALAYLCSLITGVIFLLIEKNNREVKFHALQSIVLGVVLLALWVVLFIIAFIPILNSILFILNPIILIGYLLLLIVLMIKAYQGEHFKLPYLGDIAEKQMDKF